MEIALTYIIVEGVLLFILNKQKLKEHQILQKWKLGDLTYEEVLELRHSKRFFLNRSNKNIRVAEDPEVGKKID